MANLPVPSPRTFQPSEIETGANFNSQRDALTFLLNRPRARMTQASAATPTATSAWTAIGLDNTIRDTYGGHSNVTNNTRYTAIVPGLYRCVGIVPWVANAGGVRLARIQVNGTPAPGSATDQNAAGVLSSTAMAEATVFLNAGDYVEVAGWQNTGGALNTAPGTADFAPSLDVIWEATS